MFLSFSVGLIPLWSYSSMRCRVAPGRKREILAKSYAARALGSIAGKELGWLLSSGAARVTGSRQSSAVSHQEILPRSRRRGTVVCGLKRSELQRQQVCGVAFDGAAEELAVQLAHIP